MPAPTFAPRPSRPAVPTGPRRERPRAAAVVAGYHPTGLARCADGAGTFSPLFFSDQLIDIARAKAICSRCPVRRECLRGALERGEPAGVWGGELLSGGNVTTKRPTGRPPKYPRPELVVDELGAIRRGVG